MTEALAMHEKLEVHEMVTFKNLCVTKSATMSGLVKCEELKAILSMDVTAGRKHIQQLQSFLQEGDVKLD
ncbi:hypothetical protein [Halalkalibacter akibai]|uniref:Spore coat protein n=1 Tax=Halalkalibacter akibai (strain ATCC 43226 / DSM 21942 / CIP 109018 / JCM 9157 / 1139) TaxID=1236973 RepID=W4R0R0_HALA3|nr:hypothetical protein [Halalkalibacter akibai]GAE37149.1 spore coat protein [Halalkalibacter akibai JCM 9157]